MPQPPLNPAEFVVVPHVAMVDEFEMTDDTGSLVASVNSDFIQRIVNRMREREAVTGDLSPLVIGHTNKRLGGENNQPQLVGFLRNWTQDLFFDTGRTAAFADVWFYKTVRVVVDGEELVLSAKEVNQRWPRRSAEIWPETYDVDPVSILGATTPARDLGLIQLSRNGSITYFPPGEISVPDLPNTPSTPQSPSADAGASMNELPIFKQILSALEAIQASVSQMKSSPGADMAAPYPTGAPGDASAAPSGDDAPLSDEELAALLGEGGPEGGVAPSGDPNQPSRKGQEPVQNMGYAGGPNTPVQNAGVSAELKLDREELNRLRNEVSRLKLSKELSDLRSKKGLDVDPEDQELLSDLSALPDEMQKRLLGKIVKLARQAPITDSFDLDSAVANSSGGGRARSRDDVQKIVQLAWDKRISYDAAAAELGFSVGSARK